jgi:hypothetical protein
LSWCEHSVYWRDTVAFTGHGSQQFLGVFEAHARPGRAFETDVGRKSGARLPKPRVPATTTAPVGSATRPPA